MAVPNRSCPSQLRRYPTDNITQHLSAILLCRPRRRLQARHRPRRPLPVRRTEVCLPSTLYFHPSALSHQSNNTQQKTQPLLPPNRIRRTRSQNPRHRSPSSTIHLPNHKPLIQIHSPRTLSKRKRQQESEQQPNTRKNICATGCCVLG
jgi:hypothetical protein